MTHFNNFDANNTALQRQHEIRVGYGYNNAITEVSDTSSFGNNSDSMSIDSGGGVDDGSNKNIGFFCMGMGGHHLQSHKGNSTSNNNNNLYENNDYNGGGCGGCFSSWSNNTTTRQNSSIPTFDSTAQLMMMTDDDENDVPEDVVAGGSTTVGNTPNNKYDNMTSMANVDVITTKQVAQDLSSLSVTERTKIHEEIHGIVENKSSKHSQDDDALKKEAEEEDPIMISQALLELQVELDKYILDTYDSPYQRSISINPEYAGSTRFQLMFLRCTTPNKYNPKEAAKKIIQHFEWKAKLFPKQASSSSESDLLGRPLRMDDLYAEEDDMEHIYAGSFMFLPTLDMAGRRLYFCKDYVAGSLSKQRVVFYQLCDALWRNQYNEQHLGIVFIAYFMPCNNPRTVSNKVNQLQCMKDLPSLPSFREALPIIETAVHYCYNSSIVRTIFQLQQRISSKQHRLRVCPHFGTHVECQYQLMSYGIHPQMLVVDNQGNIRSQMIERYIQCQKVKESKEKEMKMLSSVRATANLVTTPSLSEKETTQSIATTLAAAAAAKSVTPPSSFGYEQQQEDMRSSCQQQQLQTPPSKSVPVRSTNNDGSSSSSLKYIRDDEITDSDVLLGRGVPIQSHPGNMRLQKLIEDHSQQHRDLHKNDKMLLTWKILKTVQQDYNGRFLERIHPTKQNFLDLDNTTQLHMLESNCAYWKEVTDNVAREKVSYGFRSFVKMQKQKQQRQQRQQQRK